MIKAIAIDDEPLPLEIIRSYCDATDEVQLLETFTKTSAAKAFLTDNEVDLLFLDINMPSISGIDFYKNLDEKVMVIFTTAYSEYAVEGFNLSAIDYLLKPFSKERFQAAIHKAVEYYEYQKQQKASTHLFIKADYSIHKVALDDINYVEGLADYLKIHFESNNKPLMARLTMKKIEELLPASFLRIHKSYVINLEKISTVKSKSVIISNQELPIGRSYKADFEQKFKP